MLNSVNFTDVVSIIKRHETFANITTWFAIILVIIWAFAYLKFKNRKSITLFILAGLFILSLLVSITGYWGGELVYTFNVLNFR
jgi:uncharacterized membrane protein